MISSFNSRTAEINRQTQLSQAIARDQVAISTGKRLQVASDDPVAAARIAEIRSSQADQTTWQRNIQTAQSVAAEVDTNLSSVQDLVNRVKELTLAGASQTASATDRQAMVAELQGLQTTLANLEASTTPTGQQLFPTTGALQISVSPTQNLPATGNRADTFDNIVLTSGTGSLASVISSAISAISTTDPAARSTAGSASLANIDLAATYITNQRSAQGVRAARLDAAATSLIDQGTQLAAERSGLEDTDVAATVMKLNAKTLALQAAQAAFAKVNRNTLFDFLG